jgi:hypothetical protein
MNAVSNDKSRRSAPRGFWLIVAFLFMCLSVASPTLAIEKHKKDADTTRTDTTVTTTPTPAQPIPQSVQTRDTAKVVPRVKRLPVFNDFIDLNRNGVDDRIEQGNSLVPPKKATPALPAPQKADTTKVVAPVKKTDTTQKKDK